MVLRTTTTNSVVTRAEAFLRKRFFMGVWTAILTGGQDLQDSQEKKVGVSAESWMTESLGERVCEALFR